MSPAGMPYSTVLFRPASPLRWSLQWRQLWPLLDADADRADLELRLIKLLLKDRARVHPFADNGGSWRKADVHHERTKIRDASFRDLCTHNHNVRFPQCR